MTSDRGSGFSRVLIATDGSADARLAARAAIDLARRAAAVLDIVSAWAVRAWPYGIYGAYGSGFDEVLESAAIESKALVEAVAAEANAAGVLVGHLPVLNTAAAEAVIATADELGDDLIVVGSRGLGPVGRLLVGSVSDAIVHHAGRAVLVLRGGDQAWPPGFVIAADDGDDASWRAMCWAADIARLLGARLEHIEVVPPAARFARFCQ